jgi:phage gp46-like protein
MTDIALHQIGVGTFGVSLSGADLLADDGLETSVIISLFSDARLPSDQGPPDGTTDPRGWWGDIGDADGVKVGSLLWTLWREKVTPATIARAIEYCRGALQWMIDDSIASAINVIGERAGLYQISLGIEIIKQDGDTLQYSYLWDGQAAKLSRAL